MISAAPIVLGAFRHDIATASLHSAAPASMLFGAGEEIFSPGDNADQLYHVEFGTVRVFRLLADGRRQISSFHLPGEVFGFGVDGVHHFFADAITPTRLHPMPQPTGKQVASEVLDIALRCLVATQQHLLMVGRQNALERISAFLLDLRERQGGLDHLDLPMSRADIGDYLGLTIETVSRVLSRLRAQGIVRLTGLRTIEITKPAVLRAMCA